MADAWLAKGQHAAATPVSAVAPVPTAADLLHAAPTELLPGAPAAGSAVPQQAAMYIHRHRPAEDEFTATPLL